MSQLLSNRVLNMAASPTLSITQKAMELKRAGKDVISFSVGEPDFNMPKEVEVSISHALQNGKTKYTQVDGIPELKTAIINKFKNENELDYQPNEIMVSVGAKHIIFNALMATINDGDEVIIPAPFWVSYPEMVSVFGGKPIILQTKFENKFKATAQEIAQKITPKTKWIILNSPSNPTGEVYSKDELLAIGKVLLQHPNIHILSDDIYEHLLFTNKKYYTMAQVMPSIASRVLTVNGVSKAYAMTGLRIGYAGIKNSSFIKAMANIQSQSTTNPASICQYGAITALEKCQDFILHGKTIFQERRDAAVLHLQNIPNIKFHIPDGAFYIFFNVEYYLGKTSEGGVIMKSCIEICEYLMENGVATVHGTAFGTPGYIRISYATSIENIKEGILRIKNAFNKLK